MNRQDPDETSAHFCQDLWRLAYLQGLHYGLQQEDAQDCASEFILHWLTNSSVTLKDPEEYTRCWWYRCVKNWIISFRRHLNSVRRHEARWPRWETEESVQELWEVADERFQPEACLLLNNFKEKLQNALLHLTPSQRELFIQHHINQVSIEDLSIASGRTEHAIEQSLYHVRKRLREILTRQGFVQEYCTFVPPPSSSYQRTHSSNYTSSVQHTANQDISENKNQNY
jgi:RNA polymerase sigma factor (sigma-70 family)